MELSSVPCRNSNDIQKACSFECPSRSTSIACISCDASTTGIRTRESTLTILRSVSHSIMASADAAVHLVNSVLLDIRRLLKVYNRTTFNSIPDRVRARRLIMDKLNLVKTISSTIPVKVNKRRDKDAFFLQIYMLEIDVSLMHYRDAYGTPPTDDKQNRCTAGTTRTAWRRCSPTWKHAKIQSFFSREHPPLDCTQMQNRRQGAIGKWRLPFGMATNGDL